MINEVIDKMEYLGIFFGCPWGTASGPPPGPSYGSIFLSSVAGAGKRQETSDARPGCPGCGGVFCRSATVDKKMDPYGAFAGHAPGTFKKY